MLEVNNIENKSVEQTGDRSVNERKRALRNRFRWNTEKMFRISTEFFNSADSYLAATSTTAGAAAEAAAERKTSKYAALMQLHLLRP